MRPPQYSRYIDVYYPLPITHYSLNIRCSICLYHLHFPLFPLDRIAMFHAHLHAFILKQQYKSSYLLI